MSVGMNAELGVKRTGIEHLRQSIAKILTTPVGSRVQRRTFGSLLPDLIDQPLNDFVVIQLYAATATALLIHEPRFKLQRVTLNTENAQQGGAELEIHGLANVDELSEPIALRVEL